MFIAPRFSSKYYLAFLSCVSYVGLEKIKFPPATPKLTLKKGADSGLSSFFSWKEESINYPSSAY